MPQISRSIESLCGPTCLSSRSTHQFIDARHLCPLRRHAGSRRLCPRRLLRRIRRAHALGLCRPDSRNPGGLAIAAIETSDYPTASNVFDDLRSESYITNQGKRGIELNDSEFSQGASGHRRECVCRDGSLPRREHRRFVNTYILFKSKVNGATGCSGPSDGITPARDSGT